MTTYFLKLQKATAVASDKQQLLFKISTLYFYQLT